MAVTSSSISFILSKAATSSFHHTTEPTTPKHTHVIRPTLKNLVNGTYSNYTTADNISEMILEKDWLSDKNFSDFTNFSESSGNLLEESWWNVFDKKYLRHSIAWTTTLIVAYMLILFVGVNGNFMVILVVLLRPQMRSVTNLFIMNLAVADLFVILFCVTPTLLSNIFTPWILGSFMCKGVAYVQGVSVCASAYSLAAISIDRCKAVYRPFDRPSGLSRSQALATTCLIWIISLGITIPWAVVFNVNTHSRNNFPYCTETWENEYHGKLYFLITNFNLCYCFPLLLISISNLVIWYRVTRREVPQDTASAGPIKQMHKKARHGVLKMLGVVTFTFLLSWLPLYIIVMRMKFGENLSDYEYNLLEFLMPFAQWLGSWNSCINPILYSFLNKKFRDMFKSLLSTCTRKNFFTRLLRSRESAYRTTNGTVVGFNETTSCTSIYIARSSTRSSNNSRRLRRHRSQNNNSSGRPLLVSYFRNPERASVRRTTTVVAIGGTSRRCTRNNVIRSGTGQTTEV